MKTTTLQTIGLAAMLAFSIHASAAPFIVQPVGAAASSVYGVTTGPENTINGGGLADLYASLPTGAPTPALWPGHSNFNNGVNWHADNPASPLTITFDLGSSYHLTGMHLQNMNQGGVSGRSIKTATVSVSSDGSNFTDFTVGGRDSNGYFLQAPGSEGYRGQDYTFNANAKWVRFSITSDWYGNLQYASISEVRFIATTGEAVRLTARLNGGFQLEWPSVIGSSYQLPSATNLPAGSWLNEAAPFPGTGGVVTANLPLGPEPAQFFRL